MFSNYKLNGMSFKNDGEHKRIGMKIKVFIYLSHFYTAHSFLAVPCQYYFSGYQATKQLLNNQYNYF